MITEFVKITSETLSASKTPYHLPIEHYMVIDKLPVTLENINEMIILQHLTL